MRQFILSLLGVIIFSVSLSAKDYNLTSPSGVLAVRVSVGGQTTWTLKW